MCVMFFDKIQSVRVRINNVPNPLHTVFNVDNNGKRISFYVNPTIVCIEYRISCIVIVIRRMHSI